MILYQPQWKIDSKKSTYFKNRLSIIEPYIKDFSSIIDIGCNYGWNSFELSNKNIDITGIDTFSDTRDKGGQIEYFYQAQELIKQYDIKNVKIIRDEITNYLKDKKFDVALCLLVLHHYLKIPNTFDLDDEYFGLSNEGLQLIKIIKNNCGKCFFQLRLENIQDYLIEYFFKAVLEYNNVELLRSKSFYFCSPNPIIMCS